MIVRRDGADGAPVWLVVRQADHARLAGRMVALARHPELVAHPWRREILLAVAEHDNGWWEEDAAPRLDPETGGPTDFRSLPPQARREVWERGVERLATETPYAAALIAGHFLRVGAAIGKDAADAELRDRLARRQTELLAAAGAEPADAARDDAWLRLGDELSLVAATRDENLFGAPGWRIELTPLDTYAELRTEPFPWAAATRFELEARRLALRRFPDPVTLGRELAVAPRITLSIRLAPLVAD